VVENITVQELAQRLQTGDVAGVQLIDVREAHEVELAALPGFQRLSLSESGQWAPRILEILDPEAETLVLCHHGMRSAQMCSFLVSQGFTNVKNIQGGIASYSTIDKTVPRY